MHSPTTHIPSPPGDCCSTCASVAASHVTTNDIQHHSTRGSAAHISVYQIGWFAGFSVRGVPVLELVLVSGVWGVELLGVSGEVRVYVDMSVVLLLWCDAKSLTSQSKREVRICAHIVSSYAHANQ